MQTLHLKIIKRQYIYSSIEDSEVLHVFERNNARFEETVEVLSEQKSDSSAFLNVMCLLMYSTANSSFHFSYSVRIIRHPD
jgi:hypothetical protein